MSSTHWPPGSLRRAVLSAYERNPGATAAELAQIIGSQPNRVRAVLAANGLKARPQGHTPIIWTDDMKAALLRGILKRRSAVAISRTVGVSDHALLSGAAEIIRELHERKGSAE